MSKRERNKGLVGEREVKTAFTFAGFPVRGLEMQGDHLVVGRRGVPLHLEVKRQERIEIERWCRQSEAETPDGCIGIVVWRRSRQPWRVTLELDALLALLQEDE